LQIEDYLKAGKIAGEVRENVRKKNWIGNTLAEICEYVESEIIKRGAKCAFPVNTSLNEVAAHYTAEPNDPKTVSDTDLIKINFEKFNSNKKLKVFNSNKSEELEIIFKDEIMYALGNLIQNSVIYSKKMITVKTDFDQTHYKIINIFI